MKANEFVKKFGWDKVKSIVLNFNYNSSNKFIVNLNDNSAISIYELKHLVESHELVESHGGLNESKRTFEMRHGVINLDGWGELKQAIADVESCK